MDNFSRFNKRRRFFRLMPTLIVVGAVAACAGIVGGTILWVGTKGTQACVVVDKDRTNNSEGGSDQRIYTNECGILTVNDSALFLKFNSSDTYSAINVGEAYEFETVGWRSTRCSLSLAAT